MRPLETCWGGEGKGGGGQRQHLPGPHLWLVQGEGGRHVGEGRGRGAGGNVNTYLVLTCGWCKVREGDMLGRGGEGGRGAASTPTWSSPVAGAR